MSSKELRPAPRSDAETTQFSQPPPKRLASNEDQTHSAYTRLAQNVKTPPKPLVLALVVIHEENYHDEFPEFLDHIPQAREHFAPGWLVKAVTLFPNVPACKAVLEPDLNYWFPKASP